jgi:hypothetical protein
MHLVKTKNRNRKQSKPLTTNYEPNVGFRFHNFVRLDKPFADVDNQTRLSLPLVLWLKEPQSRSKFDRKTMPGKNCLAVAQKS